MFCVLRLELELPHAFSLKDKRQTLRSVKDRLRRRNISVAEVDRHDSWRRATLEFAAAAVSHGAADEKLQEIRQILLAYDDLFILDWHEEVIKL
ncbi:DUF503 domain-containing protein [Rubrobacter taiwanensis]|jgi:uncharacterized protein YlxP (DUF503 family)|uniref:DUF503 domain-containing protein n=1 Tax=Rubrobacter taiwanensis TaxID=185139 RepID=A0A4R1BHE4_9ACTN|nr:DUF503 domain-containing protein [Rubrobacter taiwanensis]TCJ16631.1 DUF503 domain-containing protein [Rubrobacter taiwanensis]